MAHQCHRQGYGSRIYGWSSCIVCCGRQHEPGCKVRKNAKRDCCDERHAILYAAGITHGFLDSSLHMLWHDGTFKPEYTEPKTRMKLADLIFDEFDRQYIEEVLGFAIKTEEWSHGL